MKSGINEEFWVVSFDSWNNIFMSLHIYIDAWLKATPKLRELSSLTDFLEDHDAGDTSIIVMDSSVMHDAKYLEGT